MNQNFELEIIEEYKLSIAYQEQITLLLQQAFPTYPEGHYYNQLPSFRYLIWNDKELIGHMAIEHRVVRLGEELFKIFGIVDLCVNKEYQSQNIGSFLLNKLETEAKNYQIDFMLLAAERFDLYLAHDFQIVENSSKWLMVQNHKSIGVLHRKLKDCLLYKSVSVQKWTGGTLDLLGTLF